jgi:hypothetical protein
MKSLKEVIDGYMEQVPDVKRHCSRCLEVKRYSGDVVLMVVDASFVSLGLNYFNAVVPKVFEFKEKFIETDEIQTLRELAEYEIDELTAVWKNRRSWNAAKEIARHLSGLHNNDRGAIIRWARKSTLEGWRKDPIGEIRGVGINTYQYLRMMGGIDTVVPDKIVKRVFKEIGEKSGVEIPEDDLEFVKKIEKIGRATGHRPIELCWMTWLVQYEGSDIRIKKYSELMEKI